MNKLLLLSLMCFATSFACGGIESDLESQADLRIEDHANAEGEEVPYNYRCARRQTNARPAVYEVYHDIRRACSSPSFPTGTRINNTISKGKRVYWANYKCCTFKR